MKDFRFGIDNSKVLFIGKNLMSFQKKNVPHRTSQKDGGNLSAFFNAPYVLNKKKVICFYCKKPGHVINFFLKMITNEKNKTRKYSY